MTQMRLEPVTPGLESSTLPLSHCASLELSWQKVRLGIKGSLVGDSQEALCCILQQDTFSSAQPLFNPGSHGKRPKMTEKLLTRTESIKTHKKTTLAINVIVYETTVKNVYWKY